MSTVKKNPDDDSNRKYFLLLLLLALLACAAILVYFGLKARSARPPAESPAPLGVVEPGELGPAPTKTETRREEAPVARPTIKKEQFAAPALGKIKAVTPTKPLTAPRFVFQALPYDAPLAEFPLVLVWQKNREFYRTRDMEMDRRGEGPEGAPTDVYAAPKKPKPHPKPPPTIPPTPESPSGL